MTWHREMGDLGRAAHQRIRDDRVENYAQLRARRYTREQAAWRLGITERTARRYEARLREQVNA